MERADVYAKGNPYREDKGLWCQLASLVHVWKAMGASNVDISRICDGKRRNDTNAKTYPANSSQGPPEAAPRGAQESGRACARALAGAWPQIKERRSPDGKFPLKARQFLVAAAVLAIKFLPLYLLPIAVAVLYAWINWGRALAAINRNPTSARLYAGLSEPAEKAANALGVKALDLVAVKRGDTQKSDRVEKPQFISHDSED